MGWLLVFRTNTAHARWWEATHLWGALINASRNLSLKISRLGNVPPADKQKVRQLVIDFAVALKLHLRRESASKIIEEGLISTPGEGPYPQSEPQSADLTHAPLAITNELYRLMESLES